MTDKELDEHIEQLEKEAFIERVMGREEKAKVLEVCSFSLRKERNKRKDKIYDEISGGYYE